MKYMRYLVVLAAVVALAVSVRPVALAAAAVQGEGDPNILAMMHDINAQLADMGLEVAVEQIDLYTIGQGRPSNRIHAQPFRWVAGDPRRLAQGDDITYIIDLSGQRASGLPGPKVKRTKAAQDNAMVTWDTTTCLEKVNIVKRADPRGDITIFDSFIGLGGFGNPFAADIVSAGFFDLAPIFGGNVLAFSVTFIFVSGGVPTDINGDNRLDTALNEVFYGTDFMWDDTGLAIPFIDVETVGAHEFGHSLGIGHFGPPPVALMNPVYAGVNRTPDPVDEAGICSVWASWPK